MQKKPKSLEQILLSPTDNLKEAGEAAKELIGVLDSKSGAKEARKFWKMLGPGLTTGAADDDPSGIATYSQAGSQYGFGFAWLSAFTFPLMAVVQEMCARIGLVTGRGLAGNIRRFFPRWALYTVTILLFGANTFNIGADLGAMAKATQLLLPKMEFAILIWMFAIVCVILQIFFSYKDYAKYLKWLSLILFSYVITLFLLNLSGMDLLKSLMPNFKFTKDSWFLVCGILGTTISPYLFFWQTSQEVEEEILSGRTTLKLRQEQTKPQEIKRMRIDVWTGMFYSNLVMFCIIAVCAATLNKAGITNIQTAAQAAEALKPLAGEKAYLLFTLGILGVGLLAIPVLAGGASYAIAESFKWKYGLYKTFSQAQAFYWIIILSVFIGLLINFSGIDAIKALIYSAVLNGIIAPVIIFFILRLAGNKKIMGEHKIGFWTKIFGWAAFFLMLISGIAAIATLF